MLLKSAYTNHDIMLKGPGDKNYHILKYKLYDIYHTGNQL